MVNRLQERIAIVTGASSGLGRAIATAFAAEGARVVCADLQPTARSEIPSETKTPTHELLISTYGPHVATFIQTDVTSTPSIEALITGAAQWGGRIDIMVNNAGVALESKSPLPIWETLDETFDTTMAINTRGVWMGCKYAIKQFLAQDPLPGGERGWIVNMSSIYGTVGGQFVTSYCASKGAVSNMTRAVALDCAPHQIRVNAIAPGYVQTAIYENTTQFVDKAVLDEAHPLNGAGRVEDIARIAVVLASPEASWVTGQVWGVDGGYVAR